MRIIDKIFKDKKSNSVIYILLAVGILLLVGGKTTVHNEPLKTENVTQSPNSPQAEVEEILSEIEGVGKVSVMIFYENDTRADSSAETLTFSEKEKVLRAQSVLVVADGAAQDAVREKIVRAVRSALGVEPHKIEVFERKEIQ